MTCRKLLLASILLFSIRLVQATAQGITEFPLPPSLEFPTRIAAGMDGNLWFLTKSVASREWRIARITMAGSVVDFPIQDGLLSFPNDLTWGPDGNIWFTQNDVDGNRAAVNRMTPSGTLTRFPTEQFAGPFAITVGPDRNLWFTYGESLAIGRITTAGTITDFPTSGESFGITVGADGNLWFTHPTTPPPNRIGRATPAGAITDFPTPTPDSTPIDIAAGSDGNLWFTETYANQVGRITPGGAFTEFPVRHESLPHHITAAPDGALWFTFQNLAALGRITTSGVVTEFPIPGGAFDVTTGPDGNIWFTEWMDNKIGRLRLQRAPTLETRILPVVGSTPGASGTFFRTSVQLHNPTTDALTGRVVFHPSGVPGSSSDPALAYTLFPGQTQSISDLLPAMGRSGLGSADLEVTSGSVPAMTARVFNDAGVAGTTGFTEDAIRADDALRAGLSGTLLLPADLSQYRFNMGVRTLESGAAATMTLRDAVGEVVGTISRGFSEMYHEQQSATAFLGVASLPAGGSVTIAVTSGSAIFYGATVDNTTGDPSLQMARASP